MPRISRGLADGYVYQRLNWGNGRQELLQKDKDYEAFVHLERVQRALFSKDHFKGQSKKRDRDGCKKVACPLYFLNTREQLFPPKAKELEMAIRISFFRALPGV